MYQLYPVAPDDHQALVELLGRVRSGELHGLNVTIPHKQVVIPLLDELTVTAQAVGAVNTIYVRDGRLVGDNTDAPGFMADLKKFLGVASQREALVLGAGGSARAVVYALVMDDWDVTIAARRVEQAQSIAAAFRFSISKSRLTGIGYSASALYSFFSDLSLIVNTTPLGMFPRVNVSPWPDELAFPRADVYDLVYNPRKTLLVRQAQAAGLRAQTGLGMLVEQAALAFEIWTGCVPPREAMFEAAGADR
jgi:shikimate dehydrogenase